MQSGISKVKPSDRYFSIEPADSTGALSSLAALNPFGKSTDALSVVEFHATTDFDLSNTSTVTSYPVEGRTELVDNIVLNPRTISLTGIITDVKQIDYAFDDYALENFRNIIFGGLPPIYFQESWEDILDTLTTWWQSRIFVKITFGQSNSKFFSNFVITSFSYRKTNALGGNAWECSIDATEVRVVDQATVIAVQPIDAYLDLLQLPLNTKGDAASDAAKALTPNASATTNVGSIQDGNILEQGTNKPYIPGQSDGIPIANFPTLAR